MQQKKNSKEPAHWKTINWLILLLISVFLLSGVQGIELYSAVSLLFIFAGIFLRRTYIFLGILIFVFVLVFTVKDSFGSSETDGGNSDFYLNFFINGQG